MISDGKISFRGKGFLRREMNTKKILLEAINSLRKVAESGGVPGLKNSFKFFKIVNERGEVGGRGWWNILPEGGNNFREIRVI